MKIYTDDSIPYTQEYFLRKKPVFQTTTIWILCSFLLIVFIFIACAKFEEVIKVTGFIRPEENISTVSNAVTGRILTTEYKSGQEVYRGQLLLKIDPTQLEAEKESLESQMQEENEKLSALYEIKESIRQNINLISQDHYEAYLRYELWKTNLKKLNNLLELNQKKLEQEKMLPASMTTSLKLMELESEFLISANNFDDTNLSFQHDIEAEIITLETSKKINENKLKQICDSLLFTEVRAPINGTIQELSTFNINDWIQAGEKLFNIIPDQKNQTKVEISIPAKQAGKIETGMPVKMRFPSLPYHEFGGTEGNIITIDPDITKSQNGEAYFLIKTDMQDTNLKDKKNKEYPLKVGLQVDARIVLSKKTILKFILEKINLWY